MEINQNKIQVLHFWPKSVNRTYQFTTCVNLGSDVASKYKYLDLYCNEHMDEWEIVNDVAKSASRAFGGISKYNRTGDNLY